MNPTEASITNYTELYDHVASLKKVLLVTTGRTGSDFFQSLTDGHSQIIQFTGIWKFHDLWDNAKCKSSLDDLIDEFIWYHSIVFHLEKFKSQYNKLERWDQLGPSKDESFYVDITLFKKHLLAILKLKGLNCATFFHGIHLAYSLASGWDPMKAKILFYHVHHIESLSRFQIDFPDFDLICTVREPRNTIVSGIENFKKYCNMETYTNQYIYSILKRNLEESSEALKFTKRIHALRLESLHTAPKDTIGEFCDSYGIDLRDTLLESTYHGKKWWGDMVSGEYLDGFNNQIENKKWDGMFFWYDIWLIEFILYSRLKHYHYKMSYTLPTYLWPLMVILAVLPLKYEIKSWRVAFSKKADLREHSIALIKNAVYFGLRIFLYWQYIFRRVCNNTYLADYFGKKAVKNSV
jgi:hypothetical protein